MTLFVKGNPGKPKGAISRNQALKRMLEDLIDKNSEEFKEKFEELMKDKRNFKWLCDLKASFELKELPTKLEADGIGAIMVNIVRANPEQVDNINVQRTITAVPR